MSYLTKYTRQSEELSHLTGKQKTAYLKLQRLGVPVKTWNDDSRGLFWIWTEVGEGEEHIEYYSKYWGSDKLNAILDAADLYYEWANAAVAHVYEQ